MLDADTIRIARGEAAFATRHTGWQQTFARFPQRFPGAVVHKQRALGVMEKRDPTLATLEPG